jgi:Leucine-rich repeat (LRR) protein
VNSENKIKMHDHLRDLGREIAKASGLPRRLWRWIENDIDDLLQESSVIPVRGIRLVRSEYKYFDGDDAFGGIRMRRLELLNTEGDLVDSILTKVQHPNLIWLRWNNCPYSSLPSSISMKKLRVLQVRGEKLKTLWENESQAPLQLRALRIDAFLSTIPKSIGQLKHLEWIVIRPRSHGAFDHAFDPASSMHLEELYIFKESELKERLQVLKKLEPEIKSLPESFGNLTNLHHIQLYGCFSLERLPDSFGNLNNLQHIDLSCCQALERLPDSFCKLIKLQFLDLRMCCNLTMSCETLGNISTLEHLDLRGCGKIEVLPWQVAHQRSLKQLLLVGTNLKELPSAIGELSNLEVLAVGPLQDTLPASLFNLKNLKKLRLYECKELKCLPPSLGDLKNLKRLRIWRCNALKCLPPSLGDLKNLKELKIEWCNALKCLLPSLGDLKNLKELKIEWCNALECLPASIVLLTQLTELSVNDCPLISELPFKKEVKGERETLTDLDCILPRLQKLTVLGTGISEVSFAEGVCSNLQLLSVYKCNNVVEVGTLPNTLIYLYFLGCDNLRKINYVPAKLQHLYIMDCRELEELPGVVETLVTLHVTGCVKLKRSRS